MHPVQKRPFGKNDWRAIALAHGQGIATEDVFGEDKPDHISAGIVGIWAAISGVGFVPDFEQPSPTSLGIIRQKLHAIDAHDGIYAGPLIIGAQKRSSVFLLAGNEFAGEDLGQKIAIAAGWLQKAAVYAVAFISHEVAHGLDFPLGGKDLAMRGHALF